MFKKVLENDDHTLKVAFRCFTVAFRYHYSGFLTDGTYFDDSYHRGGTYNTFVGTGWLIPGMDQALYGMCVREKRLVEIPADLAYGDEGVDGIPGGATLFFNVELADLWNPADEIAIDDLSLSIGVAIKSKFLISLFFLF